MSKTEFYSKAELYHKYRWDYNPEDSVFHHFQDEVKNLFLQYANEKERLETDVETMVIYGPLA